MRPCIDRLGTKPAGHCRELQLFSSLHTFVYSSDLCFQPSAYASSEKEQAKRTVIYPFHRTCEQLVTNSVDSFSRDALIMNEMQIAQ
jgi:hypothetical protein